MIYNLLMLDVRSLGEFSHRHVPDARQLAGLLAIVASVWLSCAFAQRPSVPVVGADGFISLPHKISTQELEGLRATTTDPSADAAFEVDVRNKMLIIMRANIEIAKGFLSESDSARETCYGFDRDNGLLKQGFLLCQPHVDVLITARPKAPDGYFAPFKAGVLYFKVTQVDRRFGDDETVYSAAMLKHRR